MTKRLELDKKRVLAALRERLERDLAAAAQSQQRTQSGATHEESRPENDKDTRALESSYLARGQAQRVVELSQALAKLAALQLRDFDAATPIVLSALVVLDEGERSLVCFLAPVGGGLELTLDARQVRVLTPESPLGRALLGRRVGDDIEVRTPQGLREYAIAAIS
jgi:hypothetical protein